MWLKTSEGESARQEILCEYEPPPNKRFHHLESVIQQSRTEQGKSMPPEDLDLCTLVVAAFAAVQELAVPGAVCNCTMTEYGNARLVLGAGHKGEDVLVISVREHKIGTNGAARLSADIH